MGTCDDKKKCSIQTNFGYIIENVSNFIFVVDNFLIVLFVFEICSLEVEALGESAEKSECLASLHPLYQNTNLDFVLLFVFFQFENKNKFKSIHNTFSKITKVIS